MSLLTKEEREMRYNVITVEMWQRRWTCHTMLQMMNNVKHWCGHLWISGDGSATVKVHITYWCHNTYKKQLLTPVDYLWNNSKTFRKVSNSTYNTSVISNFKTPDSTSSSFYKLLLLLSSGTRPDPEKTITHTHCVCCGSRAEHIRQADPMCLSLEHSRGAHLTFLYFGRNSEDRPNMPATGHTHASLKRSVVYLTCTPFMIDMHPLIMERSCRKELQFFHQWSSWRCR